jgi:hypothetical protein
MDGALNKTALAVKPFIAALDPTSYKMQEFAADLALANANLELLQDNLIAAGMRMYSAAGIGPPMLKESTAAVKELTDEWLGLIQAEMDYMSMQRGQIALTSPADGNRAYIQEPPELDLSQIEIPEFSTAWLDQYETISEATVMFRAGVESAFLNLGDAINEIAWGTKMNWSEVFQSILKDFTRMLIQMVLKHGLAKSAMSGGGPLLGLPLLGVAVGTGRYFGLLGPQVGPNYLEPYGFGKVAPNDLSTSAKTVQHLHFHGDIIGEEEYVRTNIIPQIERAARHGHSDLQLRHGG